MRNGLGCPRPQAGTTPVLGHVFHFKSHNNMKLLFSVYRRVQESETLMNMPRTHAREWPMGRNAQFFFFFYLISKSFLFVVELESSLDILSILLTMEIWFYVIYNKIIKLMNSTEGNLIYLRGRVLIGKQCKVPLSYFLSRGRVSVVSQHFCPGFAALHHLGSFLLFSPTLSN